MYYFGPAPGPVIPTPSQKFLDTQAEEKRKQEEAAKLKQDAGVVQQVEVSAAAASKNVDGIEIIPL
jgi:hypothetical protein